MRFRCLDLPIPVIFFTILLNSLGFGILIPIIPLLLADPKSQYYMLPAGFTLAQAIPVAMLSGFIAAALTPSSPAIVAALVIVLCGIIFTVFYRPGVELPDKRQLLFIFIDVCFNHPCN